MKHDVKEKVLVEVEVTLNMDHEEFLELREAVIKARDLAALVLDPGGNRRAVLELEPHDVKDLGAHLAKWIEKFSAVSMLLPRGRPIDSKG